MERYWGREMENGTVSPFASYARLHKCQELSVGLQLFGVIGLVISSSHFGHQVIQSPYSL